MKLAMFAHRGVASLGVVSDGIVSVISTLDAKPITLFDIICGGKQTLDEVRKRAGHPGTPELSLDSVKLLAPLPEARKFLGIGLNFWDHVREVEQHGRRPPNPKAQIWFNKQVTCITGPHDPIHMPPGSDQLDYEGELAVVIGARCRHVHRNEAMSVVAGYMVCNDVSVRDWQFASPTATLGKSFDTHGPTGPWLTTADEIADPYNLRIQTWVDGVPVQDASTAQMINRIDEMIAHLSSAFTLEPGDILATGTPAGVGVEASPPRFLKAGQTVRVAISGVGEIANPIIEPPRSDLVSK